MTENINVSQTINEVVVTEQVNQVVVSSTGAQGIQGIPGTSASIASYSSSALYSSSAGNSASLGGQPSSYYAPIANPNFTTGASVSGAALATQTFVSTSYAPLNSPSFTGTVILGSNIATGSVTTATNSASLAGQPGSYYYPASSITTASVAYATNSGSSNYSSSAGAAPTPASVSYSASSGTANNSLSLGGQASSYYAPIGSPTFTGTVNLGSNIATGSVTTATNSASLNNQPASYYYPASSITTASVGYANNSASLAGQPGSYYYPASSIATASVSYATNAGNSSSTSQTNFSALTISSSPVATQSYVTGQGYLVSSGSIATASNSASLGGIAAASYAQLISPTLTNVTLVGTTTNAGLITGGSANFNLTSSSVSILASTASGAKFNIAQGTTPTSPKTGDIWTTVDGLFAQINSSSSQMATVNTTQTITGSKIFATPITFNSNNPNNLYWDVAPITLPRYQNDPDPVNAGDIWLSSYTSPQVLKYANSNGAVTVADLNNNQTFTGYITFGATPILPATSTINAPLILRHGSAPTYPLINTTGLFFHTTSVGFQYVDSASITRTIADLQTTQTFSGVKTFSASTIHSANISLPSSTSAVAPLRIAQGIVPTSPVNGDIWTTSAGLYARISGSTVGPLGAVDDMNAIIAISVFS